MDQVIAYRKMTFRDYLSKLSGPSHHSPSLPRTVAAVLVLLCIVPLSVASCRTCLPLYPLRICYVPHVPQLPFWLGHLAFVFVCSVRQYRLPFSFL
jgi:hypothetical protein